MFTPPKNPYVASFTFPSAIVPKTTNKTAGYTPFPNLGKRKLDFNAAAGGKSVVRKLNKGKLMSAGETKSQNKLWFRILPDGHIAAWAAKGSPNGPIGYMQPVIHAINNALQNPSSKWNHALVSSAISLQHYLSVILRPANQS